MNEKQLRTLDVLSASCLLLWAGLAVASTLLPRLRVHLDLLAWFAFLLPLLLTYGTRWLAEFQEEGIGPLRLWTATLLAALLMNFTSTAIVAPRLASGQAVSAKAQSLARQLLVLRLLLALGLAAGLRALPRRKA